MTNSQDVRQAQDRAQRGPGMWPMYEAFFGLQRRPFAATPDPACFLAAATVQAAIDEVAICLEQGQGIAVLTGAAGTGKTLVCERLIQEFPGDLRVVFLRHASFQSRRGLLQNLLFELNATYQRPTEQELRLELVPAIQRLSERGQKVVLLCDEAHLLTPPLLEELRMLSDEARDGVPLVRLFLSGQPRLEETLAEPALEALSQRIRAHVSLEPFSTQLSVDYLDYRLTWAGGVLTEIFSAEAIDLICRASQGIPRSLSQLGDHALLMAYGNGQRQVTAQTVRDALNDLRQLPLHWNDVSLPGSTCQNWSEEREDSTRRVAADSRSSPSSGSVRGIASTTGADHGRSGRQPQVIESKSSVVEIGVPSRAEYAPSGMTTPSYSSAAASFEVGAPVFSAAPLRESASGLVADGTKVVSDTRLATSSMAPEFGDHLIDYARRETSSATTIAPRSARETLANSPADEFASSRWDHLTNSAERTSPQMGPVELPRRASSGFDGRDTGEKLAGASVISDDWTEMPLSLSQSVSVEPSRTAVEAAPEVRIDRHSKVSPLVFVGEAIEELETSPADGLLADLAGPDAPRWIEIPVHDRYAAIDAGWELPPLDEPAAISSSVTNFADEPAGGDEEVSIGGDMPAAAAVVDSNVSGGPTVAIDDGDWFEAELDAEAAAGVSLQECDDPEGESHRSHLITPETDSAALEADVRSLVSPQVEFVWDTVSSAYPAPTEPDGAFASDLYPVEATGENGVPMVELPPTIEAAVEYPSPSTSSGVSGGSTSTSTASPMSTVIEIGGLPNESPSVPPDAAPASSPFRTLFSLLRRKQRGLA